MKKLLILILLELTSNRIIFASSNSFKTGLDFHPLTYYINSVFDVGQNPNWFSPNQLSQNHKKVLDHMLNPVKYIERDGGFKTFFQDEFLGKRSLPNWGLHFFGGGYDSFFIREYFKERGFKYPQLYMLLLVYLGHLGNEAYEISSPNVKSHDNLADLYFFDIAGILLFQYPKIFEFFHQTIGLRRWSYQPLYDPTSGTVRNAGLNYIFRPRPFDFFIRPFFFAGMQVMGGLSFDFSEERTFSISSGKAFTNPLKDEGYQCFALFYEKNDFLLASFIFNGTENYKYRLNIYPRFFSFHEKNHRLGVFLAQTRREKFSLGINYNFPFGLGVTY